VTRPRVAVVTGGGRGIGAAIAEELGRAGDVVVTIDPLVALDGTTPAEPGTAEPSTADRIVAAGGTARASSASVTDPEGLDALFAGLVEEFGAVDAVVNVAGISRTTGFGRGDEADWRAVVEVHFDGYRNVLAAALPRMAAAGHGRVVGVTSGSGWRAADAGAYSVAKRAVAALTWQLGRQAPPGVTVNALSPIAMTRMVTAALARTGGPSTSTSGGLALAAAMPAPEEIGPFGAHLAGGGLEWCNGQVLFAGGSELAVVEPPRLLEVVRADAANVRAMVAAAVSRTLVPAEAAQLSQGGGNPRVGVPADPDLTAVALTCGLVVHDPALAAALHGALAARGVRTVALPPAEVGAGFAGAAVAIGSLAARADGLDALIVALPSAGAAGHVGAAEPWARLLADHEGIAEGLIADAGWARAAADHTAASGRSLRLVTLTDAATSGGHSRAQAAAQLARAARTATKDGVAAFGVAMGAGADPEVTAELAAHLACEPEALGLSGAELAVGPGWFGLLRHPRPGTSVLLGGTAVPPWLDDVLRAAVDGGPVLEPGPARSPGGAS
jgi:NAD(P)-dependent dehydrogenase (short-subunit alcohol dehydrogenase family)